MKNKWNLRRLILFSLATGCTLGGLGSGDVYADAPPYEQILYINENNTVTQHDTDPNLQVDTSGLLKDGNFTYNTGDKLSKEKRGLIIMNSKKDLNSYTVRATLGADSSKTVNDYKKSDYQTVLLEPKYDGTTIHDVNLQVDGLLAHLYGGCGVYGIYSSGAMSLDNLTIKSDLTNAIKDSGIVNTNAYFIYKGTTNIGNLYIDTKLDPKSTTGRSIAHNGLYADKGAVINVTGNTYINDHIATGTHEGYDNEYDIDTKGNVNTISKNDAVSAKHGGGSTVNINAKEDGTILNPENTVQICGNLDAKEGTIRVGFSGKDSYWYGAGVGLINYDEATQTYGDVRGDSQLQVTLADGAKWVPDIVLRGKDAQGLDTRSNYLSAITLDKGGIIDTHAYNVHTEDKDTVNNLVLYNLKSNEGTFVMDASGAKVNNAYRNAGTDFFTIKDGSGLVYVQPADISALKGVSPDNPVRFADAASGITFKAITKTSDISDGALFDYTPVIDKNIVSDRFGTNGNDWYFVDYAENPTDNIKIPVVAASAVHGDLLSHRNIDTLNQRLGELRDYSDTEDGVWFRMKSGETESDKYGHYNYRWNFYQLGYDRTVADNQNGKWHIGGAFHSTMGDVDYHHGDGDMRSYGGSLYAGWAGSKGHYMDYVLSYSHYNNKYDIYHDGMKAANADYSDHAWMVSAEYGRKFNMGGQWFIEPQSQLVYGKSGGSDYTLSNGVKVHSDGEDSLIGRLGFRLGRSFATPKGQEPNQIYLKFNALHEFSGDWDMALWGTDASYYQHCDGGDTWYTFGLGGKISLTDNTVFYGDVEKSFGGDVTTKWQLNAGLRFLW
ncbi:autotransporter outer membrane beta-barrel domain-containing protein [Megasphaera elsdenii]|uniref:Autotransporter outer membrane beta-barrel domain-containing protein n=1 Tax=Megasphaera elsdenii TaxID=907 RepID=A0A2S0M3X6_MEGEL|nr:autotransporter outer membrane beta-barrel domain-containing protein [Megasphaera elsdenii]AVO26151.1 autotransporter outer membrane beta-barrel domain-containing protein [Megasphaera elsdenii]